MTSPCFFATPSSFGVWLQVNHARATELLVGFHRVGSGQPSMTWPESVDEALCYGWIDGVRRSLDASSYTIRFTPRKPGSNWSKVNIAKVEKLTREGRMTPAGLAVYAKRDSAKSGVYLFEREAAAFDAEMERTFRCAKAGWTFFQAQAPSYRRVATHWVTRAKQPETRARRLAKLIEHSSRQERLP